MRHLLWARPCAERGTQSVLTEPAVQRRRSTGPQTWSQGHEVTSQGCATGPRTQSEERPTAWEDGGDCPRRRPRAVWQENRPAGAGRRDHRVTERRHWRWHRTGGSGFVCGGSGGTRGDLAGYRFDSAAVDFVAVKTLLFSLKTKIFKPTLKTYLSHQLFGKTKSQYDKRR